MTKKPIFIAFYSHLLDIWNYSSFQSGKGSGVSIAALKCLIAISIKANYYTRTSRISLTDLERETNLSRPMVIKGVKKLEQEGLITITRKHTNEYVIQAVMTKDGQPRFCKMPKIKLSKQIKNLGNRGGRALTALKLYIYLSSIRSNESRYINVSYEKISQKIYVSKTWIKSAIDILVSNDLIRYVPPNDIERESNTYLILGLSNSVYTEEVV